MTSRLIALMTVALGLSLAAFALLMNRYQEGVMAEVESIVSEVGQKTIESLDVDWFPKPVGVAVAAHPPVGVAFDREVTGRERLRPDAPDAPPPSPESPTHTATRGFLLLKKGDGPTRVIPFGAGEVEGELARGETGVHLEDLEIIRRYTTRSRDGETHTMVVQVERVRAEPAPDDGLLLRIPAVIDFASAGSTWVADPDAAAVAPAGEDDIVLPISTAELQRLGAATSRTSLFLFLGVLVVGTGLSGALAHRFTRPVRRLDTAIHRLAEGDLSAQVETDGRDEVGRLGLAFNDMAAKLRASRERERELMRRERLAALGRLAAGVAHDVRNPLHSIGLTLQHIREACAPDSTDARREFDRSIEVIRAEIRRLDELVSDFLRFARSEQRSREATDLGELLVAVSQLVATEAERRRVAVTVDVAPGMAPLQADPGAVRSAVLNLVMNGFEAMPDGGELALSARDRGDRVAVEVRDTGVGIPLEEQENVFDFGYTTRDGGHGLGMAMVHHVVVEEHGGHVALESRPGDGTTVRLELPRSAAATEPAAGETT